MADVNSNPAQARTGGPDIASTGAPAAAKQPDDQKGSAANATGTAGSAEPNAAPDVSQAGGKQPTDPVQND